MQEIEAVDESQFPIWKSSAVGDVAAVSQALLAAPELVNKADSEGHYPLHWAALNNQLAVVQLLLAKGANVNAKNGQGATPLHWSVVRGSLPCMEALLRAGANKEAQDSKGYRAMHVASQYDHTSAIFHLALRWGAAYDAKDVDGRSGLHWAAYKGFQNPLRLLIVLGCSVLDGDDEGLTPLHWAAMRGNTECAAVLVQAGALPALEALEQQGKDALALAGEKSHYETMRFLRHVRRNLLARDRPRHKLLARVASLHLAPLVWCTSVGSQVIFFLCCFAPGAAHVPAPLPWMSLLAILGLVSHAAGSAFMALVNVSDPGFIPTKSKPARGAARKGSCSQAPPSEDLGNLDCPAMWSGRWEQLCVTCKIVRPLRAKHDPFTDRCIEKFDHFCPWVGNAIGRGNQHFFLLMLFLMMGAIAVGYAVCLGRMVQLNCFGSRSSPRVHGAAAAAACYWDIGWVIGNIPHLCVVLSLLVTQAQQVATNLTTNEAMNWSKYKHFHAQESQGAHGTVFKFFNPFDRGLRRNCHEACFPLDYPMMPTVLDLKRHKVLESMRQQLQDHNAASTDGEATSTTVLLSRHNDP